MKKIFIAILSIILISVALWLLSRSDQFQLFGTLVNRVNTTEKVVALTFDDGPKKHRTSQMLEILDKAGIRATFFLVGKDIKKSPKEAKSIVDAGHEIGNHSFSHKRMVLKTQNFIGNEINKTNELIAQTGFDGEIYFRPPYGKKLFTLPYYLSRNNITTVTWDVDPESHLSEDASPDEITQYTIDNTNPGSIILLHPMYGRQNSIDAVPLIIKQLKQQGYRFVTVSELIELDGSYSNGS